MKYQPYINWDRQCLHKHLQNLCITRKLGEPIKILITQSFKSIKWDPLLEYDGCTLVQDAFHPCLSCFIHDYLWKTGQGGKDADALFYWIMLKEGFPKFKAKRRYLGVRLYWLFYAKWNHLRHRNVNPYSIEFKNVLQHIKLK